MTATVITLDLVIAHTRALKLPGVGRVFESLARQARDAHWSHEESISMKSSVPSKPPVMSP